MGLIVMMTGNLPSENECISSYNNWGVFPHLMKSEAKIILLVVSLRPRLRTHTKTSVPLYEFLFRNPLNQSTIFASVSWFHVAVLTNHIKEANLNKIAFFFKTNIAIYFLNIATNILFQTN